MRGRRGTLGTPKKKDWAPAFLEALRNQGVVRYACEQSQVPHTTAYRRREQEQDFRDQWDDALEEACDALELEARRRGVDGTSKPVFHKGVVCGHIQEYSDTLLIFLLKGYRPQKFRDNVHHEVTGRDGGPIRIRAEDLTDDQLAAIAAGSGPPLAGAAGGKTNS